MEAADLRLEPWIERACQLSALVGVSTPRLEWAPVARCRRRPVPCEPPLVLHAHGRQVRTGWALPRIDVRLIGEAASLEMLRATIRSTRQPFDAERDRQQQQGVSGRQERFRLHSVHQSEMSTSASASWLGDLGKQHALGLRTCTHTAWL